MPIAGFEYQEFSKNLAQQAGGVIPADMDENSRNYIINLVYNYCLLAGEALDNDTTVELTADQGRIICQFIGEWTFHKAIDIIRSDLPLAVRDETLQKIAFTVFEIAKLAIIKHLPIQQIITLVEQHVKKAFDEAIADLKNRGLIDENKAENAVGQSNIDVMAQQEQENEEAAPQEAQQAVQQDTAAAVSPHPQRNESNKILKLASLALLLKKLPQEKVASILSKFTQKDADLIVQYIGMPDLQQKLDSSIAMKCLMEIKRNMPASNRVNVNKVNAKINEIIKHSDSERISDIIDDERENIKQLIINIDSKKKKSLPPHVAAVLCNYLEEKVKS